MPTFEKVLYEKQRHGVLITLNDPGHLNPLGMEMNRDLHAALEAARVDPEIRAVVINGAGRAFSSGGNMGTGGRRREVVWPYGVPEGTSNAENIANWWGQGGTQSEFFYLWEYPKPIIAAVHGWCMGAASQLALTAHMTFAADDAVFGQPEIRQHTVHFFIWIWLAGFKNGFRYGLTGDHIDAQEAYRIGLVNKVVPKEQLLDECFNIVERVARISPEVLTLNLRAGTLGLEMMGLGNAQILAHALNTMAIVSQREEFMGPLQEASRQGGLRAFLEARDGPFQPEPFGPRSAGQRES